MQVIAPTRRWSDGTQTRTFYRTKACIEVSVSALAYDLRLQPGVRIYRLERCRKDRGTIKLKTRAYMIPEGSFLLNDGAIDGSRGGEHASASAEQLT